MVLRLDPDHPMVWRTPTTLQFGIERPVATLSSASREFGGLTVARELTLDVLARGVTRPVLDLLAAENGLPHAALEELLGELSGVLRESEAPSAPLAGQSVAVDAVGAPGAEVALLLERMGARLWAHDESAAPDLAVVVSHYVTDPRRAAVWLRDDVPHLLVEFGEHSTRVGPVVSLREPESAGPCASCIEHARTEADHAWPAIAVQALRRTAPSADALGVATAAPVVARVLTEFVAGASLWRTHAIRVVRAGRPGRAMAVERVSPHPNCGCRSLPGIGTEGGLRCAVIRPPPRRGRAARERA